jgi:GT2 family glycosyltransferase
LKSLTVAICSYQRKDSLLAQLRVINELASREPEAWQDTEIVVVLDGSTDGSNEALAGFSSTLPLSVATQQNGGLASARNHCLRLARGEIIWMLDDDLLPQPGAAMVHRRAHETSKKHILLGPCILPPELEVPAGVRAWWEERYRELSGMSQIDISTFSVANSSGETSFFRDAGGFDESFTLYGYEDNELGYRLVRRGGTLTFAKAAAAWHCTTIDDALTFRRQRDLGRNLVLLISLHPEISHDFLPLASDSMVRRLLRQSRLRSPEALWTLASTAFAVLRVSTRLVGREPPLVRELAWEAAKLAGVSERDPKMLETALAPYQRSDP